MTVIVPSLSADSRIQQRIEETRAGRAAISLFVIATIAAGFVLNMPESRLRHEAAVVAEPYAHALGLQQRWSVFAPEPRRASIDLQARVRYADGTGVTWHPPRGDDLVGPYWDYRWFKWMENVIQDSAEQQLWKPAALYVAQEKQTEGKVVTRVTLIRRWQALRPPGVQGSDRRGWKQYSFYTLTFPHRFGRR